MSGSTQEGGAEVGIGPRAARDMLATGQRMMQGSPGEVTGNAGALHAVASYQGHQGGIAGRRGYNSLQGGDTRGSSCAAHPGVQLPVAPVLDRGGRTRVTAEHR